MMSDKTPFKFVFDDWLKLAKEDPEAFEDQRHNTLETTISSAPGDLQFRLRGLQWKLDRIRSQSGSPMASCLRMSNLMWDRVLQQEGLLDTISSLKQAEAKPRPKTSATILPFPSSPESKNRT